MKSSIAFSALFCFGFLAVPCFSDEATKAVLVAQQREAAVEGENEAADEEKKPSDRELFMQIRTLYATGQLDDAEAKLTEALEQYPDSAALKSLHQIAYMLLNRANRPEEAYAHLEIYVNDALENAASNPARAEQFSSALGQLIGAASSKGGDERALELIESYGKKAAETGEGAEALTAAVLTQKALYFGRTGKLEEARALIDEQVANAKAAFEKAANDENAVSGVASALKAKLSLESSVEGGDAQAAWNQFSDFLETQAKANPDNRAIAMRFITENFQRASMLARSNPDQAEAALKKVTDFQAGEGADVSLPPFYTQQIAQLQKSIADTRRREALIGSDAAYPENVAAWVNGEELAPEDLKGKVVLLDFFAVWCGPCVATFPHLRDWHDRFHNDGLEIIGLSSYYKYGWNDETKRPERGELAPEEEQAAMEQFVAHHELRHPIAYTTDRSLNEHYVVSGIPHVVLIDRQGKVRLFKIGSGEANAHAIEEAIKECLAE